MTTLTGEGIHLHRQILETPEDDNARLVFAEWLDDQPEAGEPCLGCRGKGGSWSMGGSWYSPCDRCGDSGTVRGTANADRAEFIRLQCKMAAIERGTKTKSGSFHKYDEDYFVAQARSDELLTRHKAAWRRGPKCTASYDPKLDLDERAVYRPHSGCPTCDGTGYAGSLAGEGNRRHTYRPGDPVPRDWTVTATFRRGFISEISCTAAQLLAHADRTRDAGVCPVCEGGKVTYWDSEEGGSPPLWCNACYDTKANKATGRRRECDSFAARVFREWPVTSVKLDREPMPDGNEATEETWFRWLTNDGNKVSVDNRRIPMVVAELMPRSTIGGEYRWSYPTCELALRALSDGCVVYGRKAAGLGGLK